MQANLEHDPKQIGTGGSIDRNRLRDKSWLRDGALIGLAFAIGWWAHTTRIVKAESGDLRFQLQGLDNNTALALYYPDENVIYVYQGALVGFSKLNCTYEYHLNGPGGVVQRQQCKAPPFQP